jgi:hypothetical protein
VCALTSSRACSSTIWSGISAPASPPCSTMTIGKPPRPRAQVRSPRRDARPRHSPKPPRDAPPTARPVHSFHSLLADLATIARNTIVTALAPIDPSPSSPVPPPSNKRPSNLWPSPSPVPISRDTNSVAVSNINGLRFAKVRSSVWDNVSSHKAAKTRERIHWTGRELSPSFAHLSPTAPISIPSRTCYQSSMLIREKPPNESSTASGQPSQT